MIVSAKQFNLTTDQIDQLYAIILHAYAETEKEMWGEGYIRLPKEQFMELIETDEILVAMNKGKIVGGIRAFALSDEIWSFSLLGTDFNERGKGIGKALVAETEDLAKKNGANRIKMEVLRPDHIAVPSKEWVKNWYFQLGYEIVGHSALGDLYPEKVDQLLVPSSFDIYEKVL